MAYGVKILVITNGPEGSLAIKDDEVVFITPPKVKAISTVGAGDSFLAGFIYGESKNYDFKNTLKIATSCSVAKVCGKDSSVPDKESLLKFVDQIKITEK